LLFLVFSTTDNMPIIYYNNTGENHAAISITGGTRGTVSDFPHLCNVGYE
jgi:hypothetical protein